DLIEQIVTRQVGRFEPAVPLETTLDGEATSSTLFFPGAVAAGLVGPAIAEGETARAEQALLRIFQLAYGTYKAPWRIPMAASVPDGRTIYKKSHISGLAVWSALQAYTNAVYLEPSATLILNPISPDPETGD